MRYLLLALTLAACAPLSPGVMLHGPGGERIPVSVEIADEPEEHRLGLMHRDDLGWNSGMLFIFEEEGSRSFWMKNTKIPLDIVFFNAEREFVSMETMQPCTEDPCPSYRSTGPAKYALEVNVGFAAKQGIGKGWSMVLP